MAECVLNIVFRKLFGAEDSTDPCNCMGDLYQWGRIDDGHEKRTSGIMT
ncbi:hypothetical protein [Dysgonomonas sp. 521]|nr:hypothetical protein [Dysgonomonas sp. 521]